MMKRTAGFTIIELLVVIGIIALLATLTTLSLSRAKTSAYSIKCRSNLHQVAIRFTLYVNDYRFYPLFSTPPDKPVSAASANPRGKFWYDDLFPFTGNKWTAGSGIFRLSGLSRSEPCRNRKRERYRLPGRQLLLQRISI